MTPETTSPKYYKVFLVVKSWAKKDGTKGEDYCFTNRVPREAGKIAGHSYSISFLRGDKDTTAQTSEPAIFAWMNDMNEQMYDAFKEEHGEFAWATERDKNPVITNEAYLKEMADSSQIQPQASF